MDMPEIEHLDERTNSVDYEALGGAALQTWITYPGIAVGDQILINWRGCRADNTVDDIFVPREVLSLDPQQRWMFSVANPRIRDLSAGQVFYSFMRLDAAGNPVGDESRRRFFYVDRAAEDSWTLAVAHLQDAHDGLIDVSALKPEGVVLATAPYAAMASGDQVFLTWEPWYAEFAPGTPIEQKFEVKASDLGQPLQWHLELGDIYNYLYGFAFLYYRIEFADGSSSRSPVQRFDIVWPEPTDPQPAPLLAAPRIAGHSGSTLDPDDDAYRDGLWLEVDAYAELALGDALVLYAIGPEVTLRSLRVDVSSLDSERLAFHLEREWLQSEVNRGKRIVFSYEFARQGVSRRSQVLDLVLQRKLHLPLPVIKHVRKEQGDEAHQGWVHALNLTAGAEVRIPAEAELGDGELPAPQVNLHWEGHGSTGAVIIPRPISGDRHLFKVPRSAMAANLGRRLWVYYSVTRTVEIPRTSQKFELRVVDFDNDNYPFVQVQGKEDGKLSLSKVPASGAVCTLDPWTFMAPGQLLGIEVQGTSKADKPVSQILRPLKTEVSEDEYYDGIEATLPKEFLKGLKLNVPFRLIASASFDDGETWRDFRSVDTDLVS